MFYAVTPSGETIAHRREPGRDPVLLVHGFGSDADATWGATGWLRALADAGRGAIVVDLRGHGASSKPHDPSMYRTGVLAADLVAVLDAEGVGVQAAGVGGAGVGTVGVDVIGYSMGSQVARALARDAPGRIRRLVLGGIGENEQLRAWGVDAIERVLIDGVDASDETATAILRAAAERPRADRQALAACAVGVASDELPTDPLPMPTLIVVGDADPVAAGADALALALGAGLEVVPKRNHQTTLSSRAFKAAVLEFLAR
jgi:pimeloyl-ACP methyl ester carboxylesterase